MLDACGFELVFIETVGTGQSEVEVAAFADTTLVVQAPESGDEVQAIKAGLLEVADIVVVGKADRPGADTGRREPAARDADGRGGERPGRLGDRPRPKRPEVLLASGLTGEGVAELLAAIDRRAGALRWRRCRRRAIRLARAEAQVIGIIVDRTREALCSADRRALTDATLRAVAAHELDPYAAADRLSAPQAGPRKG